MALGFGVWSATRPGTNDAFTSVLAKQGARLVPMGDRGAVAVAPDGSAAIALTVPPAPSGKTYEAWVIEGGTPKPAGVFDGNTGMTVVDIERSVPPGAVVAVTVEAAGGVDQPTQKPMAATGTI